MVRSDAEAAVVHPPATAGIRRSDGASPLVEGALFDAAQSKSQRSATRKQGRPCGFPTFPAHPFEAREELLLSLATIGPSNLAGTCIDTIKFSSVSREREATFSATPEAGAPRDRRGRPSWKRSLGGLLSRGTKLLLSPSWRGWNACWDNGCHAGFRWTGPAGGWCWVRQVGTHPGIWALIHTTCEVRGIRTTRRMVCDGFHDDKCGFGRFLAHANTASLYLRQPTPVH